MDYLHTLTAKRNTTCNLRSFDDIFSCRSPRCRKDALKIKRTARRVDKHTVRREFLNCSI